MSNLNIALIGCGFFGAQLASAFTKTQAKLIALVDTNPTLAQALAEKYGGNVYATVEALLAQETPDLVIIATPNYAHYAPAILALNAGCHLFVETPFTLSQAHCQHLIQLAKEKGKDIFVGHLERTLPGILKVKATLDAGKLGNITVVRAMRQRWIESNADKAWWKLDANLTGGELFHLIHELDLLCWLLGDVAAVCAQGANLAHVDTPDSLDVIQLLLRFKQGALGSLEMGTAYRLHEWGIQIHGEHGAIEVNFFTSSVTFRYADGTTEHCDLFGEFEADLSLRESAKGIQQYHAPHAQCAFWLARAAEIEAQSVLAQLIQGKTSPLSECLSSAISVAEAAKYAMVVEKQIEITR